MKFIFSVIRKKKGKSIYKRKHFRNVDIINDYL